MKVRKTQGSHCSLKRTSQGVEVPADVFSYMKVHKFYFHSSFRIVLADFLHWSALLETWYNGRSNYKFDSVTQELCLIGSMAVQYSFLIFLLHSQRTPFIFTIGIEIFYGCLSGELFSWNLFTVPRSWSWSIFLCKHIEFRPEGRMILHVVVLLSIQLDDSQIQWEGEHRNL